MKNLPEKAATWTPQMAAAVKSMYPGVFQNAMEFAIFKHTCEAIGLDPLRREIWPVRYGGKNPRVVLQTSIEGYVKLATNSGQYGGFLPPACVVRIKGQENSPLQEIPMSLLDPKRHELIRAIARVIHKGMDQPQEYFADLNFYRKKDRDGEYGAFWSEDGTPFMLYKCGQSLAIRRTFPHQTSGVFTEEEMDQAKASIDVEFENVPAEPPKSKPQPKHVPPPPKKIETVQQPKISQTSDDIWNQIIDYLKKQACTDEGVEWVYETIRGAYQVHEIGLIPFEEMATVKNYVWQELIPELVKNEFMPPLPKKVKNGPVTPE